MQSLAEKVRAVLDTDTPTGYVGPRECADAGTYNVELSTFELDLRDWGLVYGVAYGIARGEDPYEPNHKVAERALDAARLAWGAQGGWEATLAEVEASRPNRQREAVA